MDHAKTLPSLKKMFNEKVKEETADEGPPKKKQAPVIIPIKAKALGKKKLVDAIARPPRIGVFYIRRAHSWDARVGNFLAPLTVHRPDIVKDARARRCHCRRGSRVDAQRVVPRLRVDSTSIIIWLLRAVQCRATALPHARWSHCARSQGG